MVGFLVDSAVLAVQSDQTEHPVDLVAVVSGLLVRWAVLRDLQGLEIGHASAPMVLAGAVVAAPVIGCGYSLERKHVAWRSDEPCSAVGSVFAPAPAVELAVVAEPAVAVELVVVVVPAVAVGPVVAVGLVAGLAVVGRLVAVEPAAAVGPAAADVVVVVGPAAAAVLVVAVVAAVALAVVLVAVAFAAFAAVGEFDVVAGLLYGMQGCFAIEPSVVDSCQDDRHEAYPLPFR